MKILKQISLITITYFLCFSLFANHHEESYKLEVVAEDLSFPWGIAFISNEEILITEKTGENLPVKDGNVVASTDKDVWKVAAFDRTFGTTKHTVGFLKNFDAKIGAFASTWNFHENNMIVIGSNEKDMAKAANSLVVTQGGMVVVSDGKILSSMPLQMAGIVSTDSFETVLENFANLNAVLADAGCKFKKPHLIPLFLPFLALPDIRILSTGLVDVKNRSFLKIVT